MNTKEARPLPLTPEQTLKLEALRLAVSLASGAAVPHKARPTDIVEEAQKLYAFLRQS